MSLAEWLRSVLVRIGLLGILRLLRILRLFSLLRLSWWRGRYGFRMSRLNDLNLSSR